MTDEPHGTDLFEGVSGLAGLLEKFWEIPEYRSRMLVHWRLLELREETRGALEDLGIPADALQTGLEAPGLKEWLRSSTANEADRSRAFGVVLFAQDLREASRALLEDDYFSALEALIWSVTPPFRQTGKVGGRKRMLTPLVKAVLQAWAEHDWQENPRLTKSQLGDKYEPMLAWFHEKLRWEGKAPSARTIRDYLRKLEHLRPRRT